MSIEQPDPDNTSAGKEDIAERPWIHLQTSYDIEAWISNYDWDLRRHVTPANVATAGICFRLEHGGEIFLHTTPDGDVLLDVPPEAQWVAPLIVAATGIDAPSAAETQIWALPGDVLTQLILGLSSLIASSKVVVNHPFRIKKQQRITW